MNRVNKGHSMEIATRHRLTAWTLAVGALACGGAAQAAVLEGELYGDLRWAYSNYDDDAAESVRFDSINSHAGFAVTTREGDYAATVVYERGLDADDDATVDNDTVRQSFLRVSSPFGSVLYGRAPTAYKLSGEKLDPFFNTLIGTINGGPFGDSPAAVRGPSYGLSALASDLAGNGFIGNQLAYVSPSLSGFRGNAAYFMNETDPQGDDSDYALGLEWQGDVVSGKLVAGVQYLDVQGNSNFTAIGIPGSGAVQATRYYAGYDRSRWGASVSFEPLDLQDSGSTDREYLLTSGWFGVTEQTRVAASYGNTNGTPFEGDSYSLGVFHGLFKGLDVYAAARYTDRNSAPGESTHFGVGINYAFSLTGEQRY